MWVFDAQLWHAPRLNLSGAVVETSSVSDEQMIEASFKNL
jgi:hypothetical protein